MLPRQHPRVDGSGVLKLPLTPRDFPLVYLAGPIQHTDWEGATDWRDRVTAELTDYGVFTLDPMRGKDFLEKHVKGTFGESWNGKTESYNLDDPWATAHGITHRDRWDVSRCGILLANFTGADKVSVGTVLELGWANAWGKYIIVVMDDTNPHWHGMIKEIADIIVPDLDNAIDRICILLGDLI